EGIRLVVVEVLLADIAQVGVEARARHEGPGGARGGERLRHQRHLVPAHVDAAVSPGAELGLEEREARTQIQALGGSKQPFELQPAAARGREVYVGAEGRHERTEVDLVIEIHLVGAYARAQPGAFVFEAELAAKAGLRLEKRGA